MIRFILDSSQEFFLELSENTISMGFGQFKTKTFF
jgi:hypothetical protein